MATYPTSGNDTITITDSQIQSSSPGAHDGIGREGDDTITVDSGGYRYRIQGDGLYKNWFPDGSLTPGEDTISVTGNGGFYYVAGDNSQYYNYSGPNDGLAYQGGSNDTITVDTTYAGQMGGVSGDGGDDTITIHNLSNMWWLDGGFGEDTIAIHGGQINYIAGSFGDDAILMDGGSTNEIHGDGSKSNWDPVNQNGEPGLTYSDDITIDGTAVIGNVYGNYDADTITVNGGDITGTISGGDDADTIILNDTLSSVLTVDGGTDVDAYGNAGADNDTLDITGMEAIYGQGTVTNETTDADGDSTSGTITFANGGPTVNFSEIENLVKMVCFTRGMPLETNNGPVNVEDLQIGDMVKTVDNGFVPVRFVHSTKVPGLQKGRPVVFEKGAIGNTERLVVSQQHRMWTSALPDDMKRRFGRYSDNLVQAVQLVNGSTIRVSDEFETVEYYHVMFDKHELVYCNGTISESWQPHRRNLKRDKALKEELLTFFPELRKNLGKTVDTGKVARVEVTLGLTVHN